MAALALPRVLPAPYPASHWQWGGEWQLNFARRGAAPEGSRESCGTSAGSVRCRAPGWGAGSRLAPVERPHHPHVTRDVLWCRDPASHSGRRPGGVEQRVAGTLPRDPPRIAQGSETHAGPVLELRPRAPRAPALLPEFLQSPERQCDAAPGRGLPGGALRTLRIPARLEDGMRPWSPAPP